MADERPEPQRGGCVDSLDSQPLLRIEDLRVQFPTPGDGGSVEAVSGVSFTVSAEQTVAVVGESGSGKSVTALAVLRLLDGGRISGGRVLWDGRDLAELDGRGMRRIRGDEIAMIFQDPMTSLDPLYTVGHQVVEAIWLHRRVSKRAARERAIELLDQVGIPDARSRVDSYPHQLSGGQRQRVMIAIALACSPRLLIADEPTTALDVTIEAQVLELLRTVQREYRTALLLVTHDMGVVAETADWVVVYYAGQVVEQGPTAQVLSDPQHPYTAALLAAVPTPTTDKSLPLPAIPGAVPSLRDTPSGCRFHPRCPRAWDECARTEPQLYAIGGGRVSRCLLRRDGARDDVVAAGRESA
jgi:oligopeptide/dipeptide ABC transporter ATP-binding protein